MLFWSVYFIDKSLSLRLGRASSLQDFDISFSAKEIFDIWNNKDPLDFKTAKLAEWLRLSLEMAKIQVRRNQSPGTTNAHDHRVQYTTSSTHLEASKLCPNDRYKVKNS